MELHIFYSAIYLIKITYYIIGTNHIYHLNDFLII